MEVKIPKRDWFVYATIYKTLVKCPKCGNTRYVDVSYYGDEWKKKFEYCAAEDRNWSQFTCDLCEELVIVYMEDEKSESVKSESVNKIDEGYKYKSNNYYKIKARNERSIHNGKTFAFIEWFTPYIYPGITEFPKDNWRLVITESPNWEGAIIHCGTREECERYLDENFEVIKDLGVWANFDTWTDPPDIEEEDKWEGTEDLDVMPIQPDVWYDIEELDCRPIGTPSEHVAKKVIIKRPNKNSRTCDMIAIYGDEWRHVDLYHTDWDTCLEDFFRNYKVLGISEKQDYPIKESE